MRVSICQLAFISTELQSAPGMNVSFMYFMYFHLPNALVALDRLCMCVNQWVSLSHETSWTLYRSQSSTDLHQLATKVESWEMWLPIVFGGNPKDQTGSGINGSFGIIALMSNISKTVTDTTMGQWRSNMKPPLAIDWHHVVWTWI